MTPDDIRRSFVAERRSLLITSFALFFYQQAGLQIEKINILGNEAKISDPWWIALALWVLWGYFFLRFYQYCRSIDKGFRTAYERQMEKLTTQTTFRLFKKKFKKDRAQKGSKYHFQIGNVSFLMRHPQCWTVKLELSGVQRDEAGGINTLNPSHEEDLASTELLWIKIRSAVHVLLSTHIATEYFLPFMLAMLPLVNLLRKLQLSSPLALYSDG